MSDFLLASKQSNITEPSWLDEHRQRASRVWQGYALPTRKTEDWKYTSLNALGKIDYFSQSVSAESIGDAEKHIQIDELNASKLVFVNGVYQHALSDVQTEPGVEVVRFVDASAEQQALIAAKLNSCVDFEKHAFAALNTKQLNDGVFIQVQKNVQASKPIHIVHVGIQEAESKPHAINSRVLVDLQACSSVTVVEHTYSENDELQYFANSLSEFIVGESAKLSYFRLLDEGESTQHMSGSHFRLAASAVIDSFFLTLGSKLTRLDLGVNFEGAGAEANINGVYLPQNKEHIDIHTCMEHAVAHCQSNEVFRGIASDEARAVFNGRIHIHPQAQKTEAYLSNKNLLTSNKAEIDTKPELEIYADDVKCAHGATVAQLDDTAVHYLKTRGVSAVEARVMLSFGFINELINGLSNEAIANYLRPKLAKRFSRDDSLARHTE